MCADLNEFGEYYCKYIIEYPYQRKGQALYNAIRNVRPDLEHFFCNTDLDCFDNDLVIPYVWTKLAEVW